MGYLFYVYKYANFIMGPGKEPNHILRCYLFFVQLFLIFLLFFSCEMLIVLVSLFGVKALGELYNDGQNMKYYHSFNIKTLIAN